MCCFLVSLLPPRGPLIYYLIKGSSDRLPANSRALGELSSKEGTYQFILRQFVRVFIHCVLRAGGSFGQPLERIPFRGLKLVIALSYSGYQYQIERWKCRIYEMCSKLFPKTCSWKQSRLNDLLSQEKVTVIYRSHVPWGKYCAHSLCSSILI